MKKLKKQLNKLLPSGWNISEDLNLAGYFQNKAEGRYAIYFAIEETTTKEQLLEKAKKDYLPGCVIHPIVDFNGTLKFSKKNKCVVEGGHYWATGDGSLACKVTKRHAAALYDKDIGWAPIIKKPVFKIDDTFMYEGDEYWVVISMDNWQLEKKIVNKDTEKLGPFKKHSTKQSALDFVLEEVGKRFEGCKYTQRNPNIYEFEKAEISNPDRLSDGLNWIFDKGSKMIIWDEKEGFIAEPVKEQTKSVWLVQHKESSIVHGCFTNKEKAEKYCKGDFAIIKIDVA